MVFELTPVKVMASQRVLSNGDTAFNEIPGIAEVDLQNRYLWIWHDGLVGKNWVLVANPNPAPLYYEIWVAGTLKASDGGVPIAPGIGQKKPVNRVAFE